MILMKFSFDPKTFVRFFFTGSGFQHKIYQQKVTL